LSSYNKSQQDALFLHFILVKNYTFRTGLLSIIRGLNTVFTAVGICHNTYIDCLLARLWTGQPSRYSDWLRAGWSGDRIPVWARFSAPVQTGPGVHPASCTLGSGSFPGLKSGRGVTLTRHPLLVSWSRKSRAIPLLPLGAVQSLSACTRVFFT